MKSITRSKLAFVGTNVRVTVAAGLIGGSLVGIAYSRLIPRTQPEPLPKKSIELGYAVTLPPKAITMKDGLRHVFTVKNPFDEPVRFDDVRSSCACTEARLDEKTVVAGGSTTLHVAIAPGNVVTTKTYAVRLLDDKKREWQFALAAKTYPLLQVDPPSSVYFVGEVEPGAAFERLLTVSVFQNDPSDACRLDVSSRGQSPRI